MSEYTPITGELRTAMVEFNGEPAVRIDVFNRCVNAIDAVHAQLERENESLKAELDRVLGEDEGATIPLPLDMDGKPIHFGDVMQMDGDSELREVVGFYEEGFLAWRNGRYVPCTASLYRHATPDTWGSIIGEVLQRGHDDYPLNVDIEPYVARCRVLCERTMSGDAE